MLIRKRVTSKNIFQILAKDLEWRRVNKQPCIHTFYNNSYINLCLWNKFGIPTISIDVDDLKRGRHNVVFIEIQKGNSKYESLLELYLKGLDTAINIAA